MTCIILQINRTDNEIVLNKNKKRFPIEQSKNCNARDKSCTIKQI